ncbi:MAG: DNA repair protein RadC [Chloroflexi bacterium]|nr:DNA repair protein RadC [Chloroflexota bacterium]
MSARQGRGNIAAPRVAEYRVGLKDLPESVRPRERLKYAGASALSTAELLAIVLRTGSRGGNVLDLANRLLADFGGLAPLDAASIPEICRHDGLGEVKAIEIKAAFELGRRLVSLNPTDRPQIRSPFDIANLVKAEMSALGQEHLRVLLLNTKNHVVGSHDVYRGSLNTAVVRVGELFREAIRQNSAALVLIHNHPSGDPTPSPEDIDLTRQVSEAGALLDIAVLDHVIIGSGAPGYVSLKERGLGFGRDGYPR